MNFVYDYQDNKEVYNLQQSMQLTLVVHMKLSDINWNLQHPLAFADIISNNDEQ